VSSSNRPALKKTLITVASIAAVFAVSTAGATTTGPNFSGNGGKTLPPFSVKVASTLFWTNSGGVFQIYAGGAKVLVNSPAKRGWTYVVPGRYQLKVNAIGSWAIKLRAGYVRPQRLKGGLLTYSGSGGLTLPPFTTKHGTNLRWRATGGIFQIFSEGTNVEVNSAAHAGSTYLSAGRHDFMVNALGSWTISWHP
jgi:hypothetical protein